MCSRVRVRVRLRLRVNVRVRVGVRLRVGGLPLPGGYYVLVHSTVIMYFVRYL